VTATRLVDVQAGENAGLDHATAARLLEQILSRSSG
jgi:hypothetical protein